MTFLYGGQRWYPCPTAEQAEDADNFFHSVLGTDEHNLQVYFDPLAKYRRRHWSAFLKYFENEPRSPSLQKQLGECLEAYRKSRASTKTDSELFNQYVEAVDLPGHRVCVEELPILAALENVRIVLFVGTFARYHTEVFQPDPTLLDNYPLKNINPPTEAMVWLNGTAFSRLSTVRHEEIGVASGGQQGSEVREAGQKSGVDDQSGISDSGQSDDEPSGGRRSDSGQTDGARRSHGKSTGGKRKRRRGRTSGSKRSESEHTGSEPSDDEPGDRQRGSGRRKSGRQGRGSSEQGGSSAAGQTSKTTRPPADKAPKLYKKKRKGLTVGKLLYKTHLLTLFVTNGVAKYPDWRLSADVANAGAFDDVVFEVLPSNDTILVDTKFKSSKNKKISRSDLLNMVYKSNFCLPRYYFSYNEIKRKYKVKNVAICTNIDFDLSDGLDEMVSQEQLNEDSIFYFEGVESVIYTFNEKIIPELKTNCSMLRSERPEYDYIISDETIRQFLNDFKFITLYPGQGNFDHIIKGVICSLGYSDQDYTSYINKKVIAWFDNRRGRYLTQIDGKNFFCKHRSKRFREKLNNIEIDFKSGQLDFNSDKKILHIVPQKDYTLNLIKVYQFLKQQEVKSLFVNPDDSVHIQRHTVESFEKSKYTYLVMCANIEDEQTVEGMCSDITRILQKHNHKKVIIIAGKDDKLIERITIGNENLYEKLREDISFSDLTAKSQDMLLEELITAFERNL